MNNIIKLIKLQYNNALSIKKYLMVLFLVSVMMMMISKEYIIVAAAVMLMGITYTVMIYEDKSKHNNLIYALPIAPKEYILSKYIYCYINTLLVMAILVILNNVFFENQFNNIQVILSAGSIGAFIASIIIPIALIFGFDKVRYILIFLCVLSFTCISSVPKTESSIDIDYSVFKIILPVLFIIFNVISYKITVHMYSKKDK